jgi:hypothetical protein
VPLGPHVDARTALASALDELATRVGADNALVIDAWAHLWCHARPIDGAEQELAVDLAREVLRHAPKPLTRGGRLHHWDMTGPGGWYARSFAGVYVVVLVFVGALDAAAILAALTDALPRIESLTVSLPPHDGPRTTSGAAKQRA